MPKKEFDLEEQLDWVTVDAEDAARHIRKLFDDFAFDNENLVLGGEAPMSDLSEAEMEQLRRAEVSLYHAARRISEIKTTLATRKGQAA